MRAVVWRTVRPRSCSGRGGIRTKRHVDGVAGRWLWIGPEMIHLMELPNPDPLEGRPDHGGRDRHVCIGLKSVRPAGPESGMICVKPPKRPRCSSCYCTPVALGLPCSTSLQDVDQSGAQSIYLIRNPGYRNQNSFIPSLAVEMNLVRHLTCGRWKQ